MPSSTESISSLKSPVAWPMKTPVRLAASAEGRMPADSTASQATVSTSRCCGSMLRASAGAMPKKEGSKPKGSSRKPPCLEQVLPGVPGSAA